MEHRTVQDVEGASGEGRSPWSAESVLESARWRERHRSDAPVDAPPALELDPVVPLGSRIGRSLAVPVIAGGAIFIVAVLIAITVTLLQGPGGFGAAGTAVATAAGDTGSPSQETQSSGGTAAGGTAAGGTTGGSSETRATSSAGTAGSAAEPNGSGIGPGTVFVHVVGEVRSPGLVELPAGSRVAEAVEQAGGTTKSAALAGINLARVLVDGEQVLVPDASQASQYGASASKPPASSNGPSGGEPADRGGGPVVELNSADLAALESLPGVGPALAQRIIDRRDQSGPFTSVDQLMDVSGIGPRVFEGLRERVAIR